MIKKHKKWNNTNVIIEIARKSINKGKIKEATTWK